MSLTLESFSLFISAPLMAVLIRYAWQRRHEPPSRSFAVAMVFVLVWALEIAFELSVPSQEWKLLLARLRPLAHLGVFTCLSLAVVQLTGVGPSRRRHYAVLLLVPAITLALSFGEESHQLFRFHYRVEQHGSVLAATSDKGPWNSVLTGYEYLLVAIAGLIVLRAAVRARAEYQRVTLAMGTAWISVVIISLLEQVSGIAGKWGASSYAVAFATAVTAWAVLRHSALELIPLARDLAIDQMRGLLFVVDSGGKLVDCNLPASTALGLLQSAWREKPIETIPEPWGRLLAGAIRSNDVRGRVAAGQPGDARVFQWSVSPLQDSSGRPIGHGALFTDITEDWRAEAALRESEQRFRNLADTAPVMIWVAGPDKLCTFFNKPWLDFTGRAIEQELGNGWADCVHPEDLDRCLDTYSSSFDARRGFQMEYRMRRADGEYRWVLDNGTPVDRDGEFAGFIGSCIDVTGQKLIEERLRAGEARLMDAERLARVGSWERHSETDRIDWSDEMYRIYGMPDAPSNFQAFLSQVHPLDLNKFLERYAQVRSSTEPVDLEFRIIRPDGGVRFVRSIVEAIRNDQGALVRIVGASQDITEQVHARELIRESEERLKNAERLAHVGHWDWDIKANRLLWSEELLRVFGRPHDYQPSYEGFLQAIAPQDRQRVERGVRDCLARKSGHSVEFQIARPNGELRTVTCISEVLPDDEGSPAQMFGACQDITDLRRAQEEDFARQKLESVGTLANGIAHDFNNLLGGILAQAELALAELAAGSHPEEELTMIREATVRGSAIVHQLMIYAGKEVEVAGLVDVSQIVEQMLELLKFSVSKRAMLASDLGKGLPCIRASAGQLRQIVMNLVTNASEAIRDRGGIIRVTTAHLTEGRDRSETTGERLAEGDYVRLEVSDTGCGMPLETQAKVFDPFFTTKSAGHGLGLAVVQGIVRSLGGAIRLESEPGTGTTFQILLPCVESTVGTICGQTPGTEQSTHPHRADTILIVEDEDTLRRAVSKMLRKAGFSAIEARDGSAAMEAIRVYNGAIDVLLLDVTLPGTPSHEVLEEARRLRPEMIVIVTSAYSQDLATETLRARVDHFIGKPYRIADLIDMVRQTTS